jgi:hypothetical protein
MANVTRPRPRRGPVGSTMHSLTWSLRMRRWRRWLLLALVGLVVLVGVGYGGLVASTSRSQLARAIVAVVS